MGQQVRKKKLKSSRQRYPLSHAKPSSWLMLMPPSEAVYAACRTLGLTQEGILASLQRRGWEDHGELLETCQTLEALPCNRHHLPEVWS